MNLIYNSEHFTVVAYPAEQGFELVDKDTRRISFLHGASASSFRSAIDRIPEQERDFATIDALLEDYSSGCSVPIAFH